MSLLLTPSTVKPLASFRASGAAGWWRATELRYREAGAGGLGVIVQSWTIGWSGRFDRTITAPPGPDRQVEVVLRQRRWDGVWAQADMKLLTIAGSGGGTTPQPPDPPPPGDTTPPVVSNVSASVTTTTATVVATTNEAATVIVEYNTTGVWPGTMTAATSSGTSHSRTLTGLTPGQVYQYRIRATDTANNLRLDGTRAFTTTTAPTLPGAPTGLNATGGANQVALSWTPPASNGGSAITGYRLYRNGASLIVLGVVTSYTNTGLTNGLTYSYTVAAITGVGEGPQSNTASATPAAAGDIDAPIISNVTISGVTQTGATISWTTNEAATGLVRYGTSAGSLTSATTATASGTSHQRTLSGLQAGVTYYFRVEATDTAGNLRLDSVRSFQTPINPPSGFEINPGTGTIAAAIAAGHRDLVLRGGVYSDSFGSAQRGDVVTLTAYPGETPIIDGTGLAQNFVYMGAGAHWTLDGITGRDFRPTDSGVLGCGAGNLTLRNVTWTGLGALNTNIHIVYCFSTGTATISDSSLTASPGSALQLYSNGGAHAYANVTNSVLSGLHRGVYAYDGTLTASNSTILATSTTIDLERKPSPRANVNLTNCQGGGAGSPPAVRIVVV